MKEYKELLRHLLDRRARGPTVLGGMTPHPDPRLVADAVGFIDENMGDLDSYPATKYAVSYISEKLSSWMFHGKFTGIATSGGSESNILALYAAREEGYTRVAAFRSAHYSIAKAARLLGMEMKWLPVEDGYKPLLNGLEESVDDRTVLVVTVGTTETGYIDPVNEAASIACRMGARIHVDGAYAGILQGSLGSYKVPRRLDSCIQTYAVDLHKLPEAPSPSGFLLVYDENLVEKLYFAADYIPSGRQFGLYGTRPGWTVVAGALSLARIEDTGGIELFTRRLMDASRNLADSLSSIGFNIRHPIETPVLCLEHGGIDRIISNLGKAGYRVYRCMKGRGIRLAVTPWLIRSYGLEGVASLLGDALSY